MLQDPNVERIIKNYTEPLQKQISMIQIELIALKQQCNIADVRQQSELLKAFCSMLLNAGDLTQQIRDEEMDSFLKAFNCA